MFSKFLFSVRSFALAFAFAVNVVNLSWLKMPRIIISQIMLSPIYTVYGWLSGTRARALCVKRPESCKQFILGAQSIFACHLFARQAKATQLKPYQSFNCHEKKIKMRFVCCSCSHPVRSTHTHTHLLNPSTSTKSKERVYVFKFRFSWQKEFQQQTRQKEERERKKKKMKRRRQQHRRRHRDRRSV